MTFPKTVLVGPRRASLPLLARLPRQRRRRTRDSADCIMQLKFVRSCRFGR